MEPTALSAPTTGPRAALHGIANFRERLVSDYGLKNPIEYTWRSRYDAKPEVVGIEPLDSSNYPTWIELSIKNPNGFETEFRNDGKDGTRRTLAANMVDYALKLHRIQLHDAEIDRQYQANISARNVAEQMERNRIGLMNHEQLISEAQSKGISGSRLTSSSDETLKELLRAPLGALNRAGRRRKTKKHKRRARSTRSARKTRRARK